MINEQVFATRSAVMMFLVAQGMPANFVKAAINETYNYEQDGDVRDLLWGWPEMGADTGDGDAVPVVVNAREAIIAYNTMADMMTVKNDIIMIDGEPMYWLDGVSLHCQSSPSTMMQKAAMLLAQSIRMNYERIVLEQGYKGTLKQFATDELSDNFGEEVWGELGLGPNDE